MERKTEYSYQLKGTIKLPSYAKNAEIAERRRCNGQTVFGKEWRKTILRSQYISSVTIAAMPLQYCRIRIRRDGWEIRKLASAASPRFRSWQWTEQEVMCYYLGVDMKNRLIVMLSLALAAFIPLNATAANEARAERVPIRDTEPYVSETYKNFSDVSERHWCKDGISYVVDNGFFAGTDRGTFEPEMATNRAMLCTVLYRLAGEPEVSGTTGFSDTKDGEWYEKGVVWARQSEILPDWVMASPNFDPNGATTRGEFAVMLRNYYEYKGGDAFNDGMHGIATLFPDIQMDEHSYLVIPAVSWLYTYSILNGTIDNKMATNEPFTRSQLAAMLMRYDLQFGRETPKAFS